MRTYPPPAETQDRFDPQDPLATAWQQLNWSPESGFEARWLARLEQAQRDTSELWSSFQRAQSNHSNSPVLTEGARLDLTPVAAIQAGEENRGLIAHGTTIEGDQATVYYPLPEEAHELMKGQLHVLPYGLDRHYPGAVGLLTTRIDPNPIDNRSGSAKELFIAVPIRTFNIAEPEYVINAGAETIDWELVQKHQDWELQCLSYLLDDYAQENGITQIRFHAEYFHEALTKRMPLSITPQMELAAELNWHPSDDNRDTEV
jgi:hypothetical protein